MLKIFVAETVPSQNKGEAALMHGIMRSIKEYADDDVQFYLCSGRQQLDQIEYGDDVHVIDNLGLIPIGDGGGRKLKEFCFRSVSHLAFLLCYHLLGKLSLSLFRDDLWKAYYEADVIIVGHDNAFCKFHLPLILYAKLLRKKTAVYGCTIMPVVLNTDLVRKIARYALNKVDLITTREGLTYKHLESIKVDKVPLFHTADKAFILDPVDEVHSKALMDKLGLADLPRPIIGVMVVKGSTVYKAAFKGRTMTPAEKYNKHSQEIATALDSVYEHTGGTFVFVPHCIGPGDELDDRICADAVKSRMKHSEYVKIPRDELRVTELKGLMGQFDMVISERTHGGINAATMLVPTLWMTHPKDHRTYGIVTDTLELPQCLYNVEDLDATTLSDTIKTLYDSRDELVSVLERTVPKAFETTRLNGEYFKKYVLDK